MQNAAVTSIVEGKSQLGNLSLSEEALLLAAAYRKNRKVCLLLRITHIRHKNSMIV